jgi:hypothetical protein
MNDNMLQLKAGNAIRPPNCYYATLMEDLAPAGCGDVSARQGERAWQSKSLAGA